MKALPVLLALLVAFGAVFSGVAPGASIVFAAATPPHDAVADASGEASEDASGETPGDESGETSEKVDPALAEMNARVQKVFDRVMSPITARDPDVEKYTIQAVIEEVPNAWINKDNEIYVTSGLLDLLPEDDELAGVIGHEIAHGTQGHIPYRINRNLWSLFAVVALGAIAGSQGSSDWGGLLHMRDLFMFAFSRDQESEADLVGMRYARAAGYRADGLVEALKAMDDERRLLPQDSVWQQLYRTHPSMSQRITDLRLLLTLDRLDEIRLGGSGPIGSLGQGAGSNGTSGHGSDVNGSGQSSPDADGSGTNGPGSGGDVAEGAEGAARGFARALLSGDESALRSYVLPGKAAEMLAVVAEEAGAVDGVVDWSDTEFGGEAPLSQDESSSSDWSDAALEVIARSNDGLSTVFVVRLWRTAAVDELAGGPGSADTEVASMPLQLTLRQSARGWVVTDWIVADG